MYRMRNKVDNIEYAVKRIELEEMVMDGKNQDTAANNEKVNLNFLVVSCALLDFVFLSLRARVLAFVM